MLKAVDQHYDDSLVLAQIPQKYLHRLILPLGDFARQVAQSTAVSAGFSNFYCVRRHSFTDMTTLTFWSYLTSRGPW